METDSVSPDEIVNNLIDEFRLDLHEAKQSSNGKLVEAILGRLDSVVPYLEVTEDISVFARAWLLNAVTTELLKYSIEDDLLEVRKIRSIIDPLERMILDNSWLTDSLYKFFKELHEIPKKKRIEVQGVEISVEVERGKRIPIPGLIPKPKEALIPVSSKDFMFVPILEDGIASNCYAEGIIDAYVNRLRPIVKRKEATHLCFIEKTVGPVGALGLLAALTQRLDIPSFVYRSGHWPLESKLAGLVRTSTSGQPLKPLGKESRVALVYDLLVTGGALKQAALDLQTRFETSVVHAVVLFGYGKYDHESTGWTLEVGSDTMKIDAIGWYEDFLPEIQQIYSGEAPSTLHISPITRGRGTSSPAGAGGAGSSPHVGERTMNERFLKPHNGEAPYHPVAIANEFIQLSGRDGVLLNLTKLQALIYIAHGMYLAMEDRPLLDEHIQAWDFGPIVFSIFVELGRYGDAPIRKPLETLLFQEGTWKPVRLAIPKWDHPVQDLIASIWNNYKAYDADQLWSSLLVENGPWSQIYQSRGYVRGVNISNELLRDYFGAFAPNVV